MQVALLGAAGVLIGATSMFFMIAFSGTATSLGIMIHAVCLQKPSDCGWWFRNGFLFVGGSIPMGLAAEYVARLFNS